eukprot:2507105-Lingulodinium_polyedra.AAC.1
MGSSSAAAAAPAAEASKVPNAGTEGPAVCPTCSVSSTTSLPHRRVTWDPTSESPGDDVMSPTLGRRGAGGGPAEDSASEG